MNKEPAVLTNKKYYIMKTFWLDFVFFRQFVYFTSAITYNFSKYPCTLKEIIWSEVELYQLVHDFRSSGKMLYL